MNLDRSEKWFEHPDHIAHERAIDEAAGRIRPVANLPPPEASAEERDKALARARAAAAKLPALRAEMKTREAHQRHRERETLMARAGIERGRQILLPQVVDHFGRLGQMLDLRLDPKRLSEEERQESLRIFAGRREDISDSDRLRLETLAEKAADRPGFFNERREKAATQSRLAELKEQAHVVRLPRRQRNEEPGAVVLPRWVFAALQSSHKGQWTVADVGTVAAFLSMFEERRSLIVDTHFEDAEEDEPVLVGRGSLTRLRFEPGVNPPLEAPSGAGYVDLPRAVERLAANRWLSVRELSGGRIEIRLGERARKLLEREQGGS